MNPESNSSRGFSLRNALVVETHGFGLRRRDAVCRLRFLNQRPVIELQQRDALINDIAALCSRDRTHVGPDQRDVGHAVTVGLRRRIGMGIDLFLNRFRALAQRKAIQHPGGLKECTLNLFLLGFSGRPDDDESDDHQDDESDHPLY